MNITHHKLVSAGIDRGQEKGLYPQSHSIRLMLWDSNGILMWNELLVEIEYIW